MRQRLQRRCSSPMRSFENSGGTAPLRAIGRRRLRFRREVAATPVAALYRVSRSKEILVGAWELEFYLPASCSASRSALSMPRMPSFPS